MAEPKQHLTIAQAAALTGRSPRFISKLRTAGYISGGPIGIPLVDLVRGVIGYLDDQVHRAQGRNQDTRATDARTREIALRIERRMADLIHYDDVTSEFADWAAAIRAETAGIPDRMFPDDLARRAELAAAIEQINKNVVDRTAAAKRRLKEGTTA